jgi:outer membrane beta-barrel protein
LSDKGVRVKTLGIMSIIVMSFMTVSARAEVIEFPEEELATESVLPVFDTPDAVKNRTVVTSGRFEVGGQAGYNLTEAFFQPLSIAGTATYHINEEHGINFFGSSFISGVTQYTNDLNPPPGSTQNLNLQYAPRPKWMVLGNYQYTGFYGKLSLTKNYIMNLSLYGLAGIGAIYIGDKAFPVASFGLGQKFYLSRQLALRFDLRALLYQGPNVLSKNLSQATGEQSASIFDTRFIVGSMLTVGAIWLIPNS